MNRIFIAASINFFFISSLFSTPIYKRLSYPDNKSTVIMNDGKVQPEEEFVNLEALDPITKEPFIESIQNQKFPFVLAVATVVEDDWTLRKTCFDACTLYSWMFYPNGGRKRWKHVVSQLNILYPIHFFSIKNSLDEFEYVGSEESFYKEDNGWFLQQLLQSNPLENNDKVLCKIAQCYQYGDGVEQNLPMAVDYYAESANQGNWDALLQLGALYNKKDVRNSIKKDQLINFVNIVKSIKDDPEFNEAKQRLHETNSDNLLNFKVAFARLSKQFKNLDQKPIICKKRKFEEVN